MSVVDASEVFVVRYCGRIRYFRSHRDLWVLDVNKWRDEFIRQGYDVPPFNSKYRFGIHVVNRLTAKEFLGHMQDFEVSKDQLSIELAVRFQAAESWWDAQDLFPIMFVDFDHERVGAFYFDGVKMEKYVPEGWVGSFVDFANEYSEEVFPTEEKFWVKGDADLLKILNERGKKSVKKGESKGAV